MKALGIYILLLAMCFTSFAQQITYPTIAKNGKTVESFVPEGWRILAETTGDLNQDGRKDVVLVIQNQNPQFIKKAGTGENTPEYDANHRMLIVLFQNKNGAYDLADYHNTFIWRNMTTNRIDPFLGITIDDKGGKKGILNIDFHFHYVAGTETGKCTNATYKFRHQNGNFELIGAEVIETVTHTGDLTNYSFNFLNKKMITTKWNAFLNKVNEIKEDKFECNPLKNFRSLYQPFNNRQASKNLWLVNGVNL